MSQRVRAKRGSLAGFATSGANPPTPDIASLIGATCSAQPRLRYCGFVSQALRSHCKVHVYRTM